MTEKRWDAEAFRRRMLAQAKASQRYSEEHFDRIRRGQSDGSPRLRDEHLGEVDAYDRLHSSTAIVSPRLLLKELEVLEARDMAGHFRGDREAYRHGFHSVLHQVREEVQSYLD